MPGKKRNWTNKNLEMAVVTSTSIRQVLFKLNLIPAGGNYSQIKRYIKKLNFDISHFKGKAWNKGLKGTRKPQLTLSEITIINSSFQSYKLRNRLFREGLKRQACEECGWAKRSEDGRIPVELDHVNGNKNDNRLENLRILCPNCHSLKLTHRGRNIKRDSGGIGIRATLKMLSAKADEGSIPSYPTE